MNKLKKFSVFVIFAICLCFASPKAFAQETRDVKLAEPSYEVLLQVLVASNTSDNNQMPSSLGNVVKKLKSTFSFTDYRVTGTYLNRVENGGTIENRSLIQETSASAAPTFQNWSLYGLKKVDGSGGQNLIQVNSFQYGTKFPIQTGQTVSYDDTGLKIIKLNLVENTPTIIGTMNASKTNGLIVLVLTVRPSN